MRLQRREAQHSGARRLLVCIGLISAVLATTLVAAAVAVDTANARGPAYPGPQTTAEGPAFFGPAPNPLPYCDNPTYFDPWDENVVPTGRLDVGDTAAVSTDGMTMELEILAEGSPGEQYPGFFPFGGEGVANDRAKGFEVAPGDSARVELDQPLFYAQFIFTDVDQPGEGFEVVPDWAVVGEVIAYGGDGQFTFEGTTPTNIRLDDLDGVSHPSEAIAGRAQLDMLGAVTGLTFTRPATRIDPDTGDVLDTQGQSGLSVAGGCEASGAAKRVASGPTWNGTSFEVTYELRLRNNMPSEATILEVVQAAQANAQTTFLTADPTSIPLEDLRLTDQLGDPAFSDIAVTDISSAAPGLTLNDNYDGLDDDQLLLDGSVLTAESDALISLTVEYTPDAARAEWSACTTGHAYLNQSIVNGTVSGIAVSDESDDGVDPTPSSENGSGGVDDPTPVLFPCLPADLDIVKTVVPGPNGICPAFGDGVVGEGPALSVIVDDIVTYCISVANEALGTADDVVIADPQAPNAYDIGTLLQGQTQTVSYDVQVNLATPNINTATATGTSVTGTLGPVSDTASIVVRPKPQPELQIVKTVLQGPSAACPLFNEGVAGRGEPLRVDDEDTVTYCISVRNAGDGDAVNVIIADDQAPAQYTIGTLIPNEEASVTYDLVVGLGSPTVNVAYATGDGPDGPVDAVDDDAEIVVDPLQPALEIVKTVLPGASATCPVFSLGVSGPGSPLMVRDGDTVTYCISVRNSGRGTAEDVTITDVQAPSSFALGTMVGGAEQTVSYEIDIDLDTPEINTAVADGSGPAGPLDPVSDTAVIAVTPLPEPELEIVKTALEGPGALCPDFESGVPGRGSAVEFVETETVTYCISVRNVGEANATSVVIADDQAPNTFDLDVGALAAGEQVTRSFDLPVFVDTPEVNVATATGDGPYGPVTEVSDDALISVTLQPDPVLEIVKTAVEGPGAACPVFDDGVVGDGDALPVLFGQTITYCISVRNTGANEATSVAVSDPQAPGVFSVGVVAIGEEVTRSYDVVVNASTDELNTATVAGQGPNGQLPEKSDTALIDPAPQLDPLLNIVKTVVLGPNGSCPSYDDGESGIGEALKVELGDTVTYCISVRNTGPTDAQNVLVSDAQAPGPVEIGTLAAGETVDRAYDVVVEDDTPLINTALVTGDGPNGELPEDDDDAQINTADIELVHTVIRAERNCIETVRDVDILVVDLEGLDVRWCYRVTNTGTVPLANVLLSSPDIGFEDLDALANAGSSFVVLPSGDLEPVAEPADDSAGDGFLAGFVTGRAAVTAARGPAVLMPGDTVLVEVSTPIPGGGLESVAAVIADPADEHGELLGLDPVTDVDEAEVREGLIQLIKTVAPGVDADCATSAKVLAVPQDAPVTWCFEVTNIGTLDLRVSEVVDDTLGLVVAVPVALRTLTPEDSFSVSVSAPSPGAFVNVASVEGVALDPDGQVIEQAPVVRDDDSAETQLPSADMAINKIVSDQGPVAAGTVLTYTLQVTNNGPNAAADVTVADALPAGLDYVALPAQTNWACSLNDDEAGFTCLKSADMASGDIETLIYTAVVNQNAARGVALENVATVASSTEDPDETNNTDREITTTNLPPDEPGNERPQLEYPGPFTVADPPESDAPDEVLGLAITGASSQVLVVLAVAMMAFGGLLVTGARRSRRGLS